MYYRGLMETFDRQREVRVPLAPDPVRRGLTDVGGLTEETEEVQQR